MFFFQDCNYSYYTLTCGFKSLCWPLSSFVLCLLFNKTKSEEASFIFFPSGPLIHSAGSQLVWFFLWRPYHTNEHSGVIRWERFCSWKLFVTDGKNEQTLPVQNDLLQLFAIPAKWLLLPIFALCANFFLNITHYIFDINYGTISKHSEFHKSLDISWETSVEEACFCYKHLVRKL